MFCRRNSSSATLHNKMKNLLDKWTALQKQPRQDLQNVGCVRQRASEEIQILEGLLSIGCTKIPIEASEIPSEGWDVNFLLENRKRVLREMHDRFSQIL